MSWSKRANFAAKRSPLERRAPERFQNPTKPGDKTDMSEVTVTSTASMQNVARYGDGQTLLKGWPLERVTVRLREQRVHAKDCVECEQNMEGFVHRIERSVTLEGGLTDEQRARLQEIAHKCPVHRTLTSKIIVAEMKD
jgi:hypothetical protein